MIVPGVLYCVWTYTVAIPATAAVGLPSPLMIFPGPFTVKVTGLTAEGTTVPFASTTEA